MKLEIQYLPLRRKIIFINVYTSTILNNAALQQYILYIASMKGILIFVRVICLAKNRDICITQFELKGYEPLVLKVIVIFHYGSNKS